MTETTTDEMTPELRSVVSLWWLTVLIGVLSLVAGVIVLLKPSNSLATIAVVIGVFAVIDGIIALVHAVTGETGSRGLTALVGVLGLVIGVLLIRHPIHGVTAVALLFGIWLIALGAIRLVLVFEASGNRGWRLAIAIIELLAGVVIVSSPGIGITTLAILIGISLIINGLALAAAGIILHGAADELG